MYYYHQLPDVDIDLDGLFARPSDQPLQTGTNEQQSTYQGMSVKASIAPLPLYHDQPGKQDNNTGSANFWDGYNIAPLAHVSPSDFFRTDITDDLKSVLDIYLPCDSDNARANDPLSSIPDIHLLYQLCLPENEPETEEPIPSSYLNPDYQLTNPPVVHPSQQSLLNVTAANPLNRNQTSMDNHTRPAEATDDGNSSIVKGKKKRYQSNPNYTKRQRERYQNNPDYAEYKRMLQRERYRNDPDYAERQKKRRKERYKDPDYARRMRERHNNQGRKRYRNNPAYAESERERQRVIRKNKLIKAPQTSHECEGAKKLYEH
ncbi:hypothetical protein [Endozoicomonas sp. GU-1]|uniref:hypothetical protein n=1 Tax=Endozoicomonas sp. GU-1 TaxID=3009078 RepID=UPI0022B539B5|nr:hypothetical protein [Endozoicomonas sp. GU-1]WBA83412.1 hypothetical protein O2T12_09940 [Endozoicomonas sp. GU-1]WBA86343.1 hypothetical protein O3276_24605 [Endozoicomonas sp. GU-1]